ncbi:hypothetical protein Ptr86124_004622 [Pyrenophora tritici-repentis]|uniref:Uncharacterized protein n=1 Tax=Pyrenophora tritici-repentis TaxID=45151 RepID=A0A922T081_9PLEO|nr:hypothetical protein Ptr86124_004622 [Pyrenophora tritici-repentis]
MDASPTGDEISDRLFSVDILEAIACTVGQAGKRVAWNSPHLAVSAGLRLAPPSPSASIVRFLEPPNALHAH